MNDDIMKSSLRCLLGIHKKGKSFYDPGYPYWNMRDFVFTCQRCGKTVKTR